ncbi:protein grindelwald [Dendroctonus ponderosae]
MEKYALVFVCSVIGCVISGAAQGGITLALPKCGQKTCNYHEFCSVFDNTCQLCAHICNQSSNNYEEVDCEKHCQNYLHDTRYVRTGSTDDDLRGTVEKLSSMVTINLTLVIFMLLVLACVFCFQLYRWKVKKNITLAVIKGKMFGKNDSSATTNSTSNQDNKKRDLRLEIPSPTVNSDHSPVTVSTSIDRRPAEDSTLDYAYDNPVMAKSNNTSY